MLEYKFTEWKPFEDSKLRLEVSVEPPYDYLSMIFAGNETSMHIQEIIDGINKVKEGIEEDFYFGNDTGFSAVAAQANPENEEEPEEGVYIYDGFENKPEKAMFIVPIDEVLQLLEAFKKFLEENGR